MVSQRGLTLLECLLGLSLGLGIMAMFLRSWLDLRAQWQWYQLHTASLMHLRSASLLLLHDIARAGDWGCRHLSQRTGLTFHAIQIGDNALTLTYLAPLASAQAVGEAARWYADCDKTQVLQAAQMAKPAAPGARIGQLMVRHYFIKTTHYDGQAVATLYRRDNQERAQALVPGIAQLHACQLQQGSCRALPVGTQLARGIVCLRVLAQAIQGQAEPPWLLCQTIGRLS